MSANNDGHNMQLVDDFETSFQSCLAAVTNPNTNQIHDIEEVKSSVDQTIQRFLDCAKQLECFFLQKRLYLSVHKPEQLIVEDINDLKAEIQRKDMVMQKYQEKIGAWQSILAEQSVPMPGPLQQVPHGPVQNMPPGMRPQMMMGPGGQHGPGPNMRPPGPQQMQQQMSGPPQQMHAGQHMGGPQHGMGGGGPFVQQNPQQSNLQGPLAYLERTTSNIGMPDPRR